MEKREHKPEASSFILQHHRTNLRNHHDILYYYKPVNLDFLLSITAILLRIQFGFIFHARNRLTSRPVFASRSVSHRRSPSVMIYPYTSQGHGKNISNILNHVQGAQCKVRRLCFSKICQEPDERTFGAGTLNSIGITD